MSAAAGIGALSISTIEGTYRGNEKQILNYTYIHFYKKKKFKQNINNPQITYKEVHLIDGELPPDYIRRKRLLRGIQLPRPAQTI